MEARSEPDGRNSAFRLQRRHLRCRAAVRLRVAFSWVDNTKAQELRFCKALHSPHTRQWSATFRNRPNNFPVPQLGLFDLKPPHIALGNETGSHPGLPHGKVQALSDGGAMNSGPIGSVMVSRRIRSISALAEASSDQPITSSTGRNCSGCRAPHNAVVMP
jgi:hypothetical protein